MFTKQHYNAIAKIVKENTIVIGTTGQGEIHKRDFIEYLANYFEQDNALFDRERFLKACGLKE